MACTEANFAQNALRTQPRPQLLADMARSHFCLIMPGNSQSSGRLADAFFTGCIPVFLGPPFHTLPFAALVRAPAHAMLSWVEAGLTRCLLLLGDYGMVPCVHPLVSCLFG